MWVDGQLAFDNAAMLLCASEAGFGLAFVLEDRVTEQIAAGRLVRALEDWCPPFTGYHLYYPSRQHPTPASASLLKTLQYRQ